MVEKWKNLLKCGVNFGKSVKKWKVEYWNGNILRENMENSGTNLFESVQNLEKLWWKVEKSEKPGGQWKNL